MLKKKKTLHPITDLSNGTVVTFRFAEDGETVTAIRIKGPGVSLETLSDMLKYFAQVHR